MANSYNASATAPTNAGIYAVTGSFAGNGNYAGGSEAATSFE